MFKKGEKNHKHGTIKLPSTFVRITPEEVARLAKTGSEENDALVSIGLKGKHLEKAKKQKYWREPWDKARAQWVVEKNAQISGSEDVRMLSLLAPKTMPDNEIGDKVTFTVDAPEWFVKVLEKKRARTETVS